MSCNSINTFFSFFILFSLLFLGSHQDTSSDHSLDEVEEEPKHFSDQNEKYQGLHTSGSPQHGNMGSSEYKPQSETLVPQQPPPHLHDQINAEPPGTHTHSHFQDHQSHNEKQEKPGQASQNSHQFSNHHHQQPSSQQQQQQQQEDPNQHLHDEQ